MQAARNCSTCRHSGRPYGAVAVNVCTRYSIGRGLHGEPLRPLAEKHCYSSTNLCCGGAGWESRAAAGWRDGVQVATA